MNLADHIDMQWVGYRKDSQRGAVAGWFVLKGQLLRPLYEWEEQYRSNPTAFIFMGKIGKSLVITEHTITHQFVWSRTEFAQNYRGCELAWVQRRWGKLIDDEFSMFLTMQKLRAPTPTEILF
jgi:hypothetical protein